MAIETTKTVRRVEVLPQSDPDQDGDLPPVINVRIAISVDDPDDADLPVVTDQVKKLKKFDENGDLTDVSGEDQLVQDIAAAIWA